VEHKYFEATIMGAILLNTVVMSMRHARMSSGYELSLEIMNWIFACFFNLEAVLKITAYSWRYFTMSSWN